MFLEAAYFFQHVGLCTAQSPQEHRLFAQTTKHTELGATV